MDEFLCLANSRKHGGRCLAGYVGESGWVRPVSDAGGGEFSKSAVSHIRLLDLVKIDIDQAEPLDSQPENVVFAPPDFSARSGTVSEISALLAWAEDPDPELLRLGLQDRIAATALKSDPMSTSLTLIEPTDIRWSVRDRGDQPNQVRCQFTFKRRSYDFAVTDPDLEASVGRLSAGPHPRAAAGIGKDDRVLLTISLGEEYDGDHYKLVAGVIVAP